MTNRLDTANICKVTPMLPLISPLDCVGNLWVTYCNKWLKGCNLQSDVSIGVENDSLCNKSRSDRFIDLCQVSNVSEHLQTDNWLKNVQLALQSYLTITPNHVGAKPLQAIDIVIEYLKNYLDSRKVTPPSPIVQELDIHVFKKTPLFR